MNWTLIGIAALLAVGFMIFRPRHGSDGHGSHGNDPEMGTRDGNSSATHTKRGGGCCG
jgi:hypothetical protein